MSSPNSFRDLPGSSPTWEKLPGAAEPPGHLVQFYEQDERFLTRNVSRYLWQGLQQGDHRSNDYVEQEIHCAGPFNGSKCGARNPGNLWRR